MQDPERDSWHNSLAAFWAVVVAFFGVSSAMLPRYLRRNVLMRLLTVHYRSSWMRKKKQMKRTPMKWWVELRQWTPSTDCRVPSRSWPVVRIFWELKQALEEAPPTLS